VADAAGAVVALVGWEQPRQTEALIEFVAKLAAGGRQITVVMEPTGT